MTINRLTPLQPAGFNHTTRFRGNSPAEQSPLKPLEVDSFLRRSSYYDATETDPRDILVAKARSARADANTQYFQGLAKAICLLQDASKEKTGTETWSIPDILNERLKIELELGHFNSASTTLTEIKKHISYPDEEIAKRNITDAILAHIEVLGKLSSLLKDS